MAPQETTDGNAAPCPQARRKWKRWVLPVIFLGGLAWLNGPGLRWLAPVIAGHFLEKSGMRGNFRLEGSLTGGISLMDLHLESDTSLASLVLHRATPVYQWKEVIHGRLNGIEIDGLHADLRLGVETPAKVPEPEKPLDLNELVKTLRSVRGHVIPVSVDLKNISLNATKDGKPVIALAPSHIHHTAGDTGFNLDLGAITDAGGRVWPAQNSAIAWSEDDLTIARLDPLPGLGIRDLIVRLPGTGGPSAETEIHLDDAVLLAEASPGFSSVRVDLREGRVRSGQVADRFGLKLPASADLTSLSVNVEGLLPDPLAASGEVRLLLDQVVSGEWTMPELSLDVELQTDRATLAASGQVPGSGFSLQAEAPVNRDHGGFTPGEVKGRFNVADISKLVTALSERVKSIDPDAEVPQSMVDGNFSISMDKLRPVLAAADLVLKPAEPAAASPVFVKGRWQPGKPVGAEIGIEGMKVKADYDLESATYDAGVDFDNFTTARIDAWLAIVRAGTGGAVSLTGKWRGGGDLKNARHHGRLALAAMDLARDGLPPVKANGGIDYDWPAGFTTQDLCIRTKEQTIAVDAKLADGMLELSKLSWQDHGTGMAGGSARLPVPVDFSKWRDMLAHDARPLEVSLESEALSLSLLKDWLPATEKLDPRSTGRVQVKVAGTYAEPVVDVVLEAKDLRSPEQPKLPPADLAISIAGRDGRIAVDGRATAPDFPAAVMTASMPFRPADWAADPALLSGEKLTARVDLPRIDLSRFASLVPMTRKVAGVVTGNVEVAGEVGKPVFKGKLDLTGAGMELKEERYPAVTGAGASVGFTPDRIVLTNLKASVAGGTLQGGGSLALENGKPGVLDFRVTGNHLPLLRNDSLIVRADADLRLSGTFERAALTGTVGVVDSLFYRDIELLPVGTSFGGPSAAALPKIDAPANPAAAMPEPFRNWSVNLLVRTRNPFLIRGNFATGQVDVNLRVGGTLGSPAPDGEVKLSDLKAALPFSTLTVHSGFLRFNPSTGFDPILEIRGNAEPRPYRVSVFVYGKASNPQLVLTSSPPLPDNEIMTLLATGTTTSGLENPQAASSRAMQLLVEELRRGRVLGSKKLRPVLSLLDRVDFSLAEADPYSTESFSTATIMLTDRWYVSAGMGADGDSRVMGIWRFSFR